MTIYCVSILSEIDEIDNIEVCSECFLSKEAAYAKIKSLVIAQAEEFRANNVEYLVEKSKKNEWARIKSIDNFFNIFYRLDPMTLIEE